MTLIAPRLNLSSETTESKGWKRRPVNIHSSLIAELRDKTYRDAYVAAQLKIGLPFQIRALRKAKDWTQNKLAEFAEMTQPRIAEIEKPGERRLNLDTLLRLAGAFDVALEVRFVPFSELIDRSEAFYPDAFSVKTFTEELLEAEAAILEPSPRAPPEQSRALGPH